MDGRAALWAQRAVCAKAMKPEGTGCIRETPESQWAWSSERGSRERSGCPQGLCNVAALGGDEVREGMGPHKAGGLGLFLQVKWTTMRVLNREEIWFPEITDCLMGNRVFCQFARAALTKHHGWGLTQECVLPPFWGLDVCDPDVSGFGFSRCLSPCLAEGRLHRVSSQGLSSVRVYPWCLSVCPCFLPV